MDTGASHASLTTIPHTGLVLPPDDLPVWWHIPDWLRDQLGQPGVRGISVTLTDKDKETLGLAAVSVKSARAAARSKDAKIASQGRRQLALVISYLMGFFDGKGVSALPPGLIGLAQSQDAQDPLDRKLDALEKALSEFETATRGPGVGLAIAGAITYAIGCGLEKLDEALS